MLLAIDSATRNIGLALYNEISIPYEKVWNSKNYHTVEVATAIEEALEITNIQKSDLSAIAVAIGPGSYTGLRIGSALAKGLSLSLQIPLIAIDTLEINAFANKVSSEYQLASVLKAGRTRMAVGWFEEVEGKWQAILPYELLTAEELNQKIKKPTLVCGELGEDTRILLKRKRKNVILASIANSVRRPTFLAEMAWRVFKTGNYPSAAEIAPNYLQTGENIP